MRPFYDTTKEDIDNEIRAIIRLCVNDVSRNIVSVFNHGWLKKSPYYFIDMELCDLNLETFIYSEYISGFQKIFNPDSEPSKEVRVRNMWPIMLDIVHGLQFIHRHGQVHRDIKPRNSKSQMICQ